ncbi:tetraacyldisaccharide 4'-kinase [bacterium]|nr:tetraacyldisaccharide 4'-kinase [bacterium]
MNLKTEITKIHYNKDAKGLFVNILDFASLFYGIGSGLKNFLYDKNILKPKKVDAFVISVGNLTTGGVGKTPVVAEIAKYLIDKGEKVAVISRGYGGELSNKNINVISDGENVFYDAKMAGDEPYWLATNTKSVIITCKNRYEASKYAIDKFGTTHIILDDGFQHRKLHRNSDIVLADSEKMFGREKLLPAGPLREGFEALKRIDKLVIVSKNTDHTRAEKITKIMGKKMGVPSFLCKTEPDFVYNIKTGEKLPLGTEAKAVCAIGQPEQFYAFLKDYKIAETVTFDDHHKYSENEIPKGTIITTEKDAVKMKDFLRNDIYALKLKTVVDVESLLS